MCCGKGGVDTRAEWWQFVRVGPVLTSFSSEQDAQAFLDKGYDRVPPKQKEMYAALRFKKEQAGK